MPQVLEGFITKAGFMDKTVTLTVERKLLHPLYHKQHTINKKYLVHDELNELQIGDRIQAVQCRPLSTRKYFRFFDFVGTEAEREAHRRQLKMDMTAMDQERIRVAKLVRDERTQLRADKLKLTGRVKEAAAVNEELKAEQERARQQAHRDAETFAEATGAASKLVEEVQKARTQALFAAQKGKSTNGGSSS